MSYVAGISILEGLTALTIVLVIVLAPYIKKVTNSYFFWAALGIAFFLLLIFGRFNGL
jgi:maleate cis-trans isomerase